MYWGGRQRRQGAAISIRACEGELQDHDCWSKRQDLRGCGLTGKKIMDNGLSNWRQVLSNNGLTGNKIMDNGLSNWRHDLRGYRLAYLKISFEDLNSSCEIPLAAAILKLRCDLRGYVLLLGLVLMQMLMLMIVCSPSIDRCS